MYRRFIRALLAATLCLLFARQAAALLPGSDARASSAPSPGERLRVSQLSRHAADLIDKRQFIEAQRTLDEALKLSPENSTCLYNLAIVHVELKLPKRAMQDLEHAADAGFTDFSHLEHDAAFRTLHGSPQYQDLLSRRDEFRHRAAQRILRELKDQFGPSYLYEVDEPHKRVFAAHLDRAELDEMRRMLDVEQTSEESQVFRNPPDEFIRIIIASPADYVRLEKHAGVGGRYDDSTRTVLAKRIGPELRHEFTHALHAADQHALNQEHPVWLSEGLATLYEYPMIEDHGAAERMVPADTWRLARVQSAARDGGLIPLDNLFKMNRAGFTARADLAYGEAGSLLLYLYEHGLLRRFYRIYTAAYACDSTGRQALQTATALTIPQLQKAWQDWLLPRSVPPRRAVEPLE